MTLPLLATTTVGSCPRPARFREQLHGRDIVASSKDVHGEKITPLVAGARIVRRELGAG